jgi:dTDP-D-glucose 4,6-dehydratase
LYQWRGIGKEHREVRVLLTGGAGFIGSHIAEHLLSRGHEVAIVDDLSSGKCENLAPSARFYELDIRFGCSEVFEEFRPETLVHQAAQMDVHLQKTAQPGIRRFFVSREDRLERLERDELRGLLQMLREEALVHVSGDGVEARNEGGKPRGQAPPGSSVGRPQRRAAAIPPIIRKV